MFVNMYYPTDFPVKQAKNVLDNKVVLMGSFASYGGATAHGMLRINPDGSLDPKLQRRRWRAVGRHARNRVSSPEHRQS